MWALEENRNSNGETDECFCKPSKRQLWVWAENGFAFLHCLSQKEFQDRAALPEISVSMGCYTSSQSGSKIFALTFPSSSLTPWVPPLWAQQHGSCGTRPSVPSNLCWFFKKWEEEPGQCNYGKTMFKRPISSANEIGFFAVVVSLVRRRDGLNFVCSSNPEGQRKKKHPACFWRASPGLQVLRSQLGMLAQPWCFLPETLIQSTALLSYPNTSSRPEDHVFWQKK